MADFYFLLYIGTQFFNSSTIVLKAFPFTDISFNSMPFQYFFKVVTLQNYKSNVYPSNSNVFSILDVGEGRENAISCRTDKNPCCKSAKIGEWWYSNDTLVPIKNLNRDYYRSRNNENK